MKTKLFTSLIFMLLLGQSFGEISPRNYSLAFPIGIESRLRPESRAGNSVDTATGAFIQELNIATVQGARSIPFNLRYNSQGFSTTDTLSNGWSHPYDIRLRALDNSDHKVKVSVGGVDVMEFNYGASTDSYWRHPSSLYTLATLERFSLDIPDKPDTAEDEAETIEGLWRLRVESGDQYIFGPSSKYLLWIENRNGLPLNMSYSRDHGRLTEINEPISERFIRLSYQGARCKTERSPQGHVWNTFLELPPHLTGCRERLNFVQHGNYRSLITYEESGGPPRLKRIYDPVEIGQLAGQHVFSNTTNVVLMDGNDNLAFTEVRTPASVGRLARISGVLYHSKPETLKAYIHYPSLGQFDQISLQIKDVSVAQFGRAEFDFMTDKMMFSTGFSWRLYVHDTEQDGVRGGIYELKVAFSKEKANWTEYVADGPGFDNPLSEAIDKNRTRLFKNYYQALGGCQAVKAVSVQLDGRPGGYPWLFSYETPLDCVTGNIITRVVDRIRNPDANRTLYTHSPRCELLEVENALDQKTTYTYNELGQRASITDAMGGQVLFTYNGLRGWLEKTYRPDGRYIDFRYDEFPIEIEKDGVMVNDAFGRGNVTSITDATRTNTTRFTYDQYNNLTSVTNPMNAVISRTYNPDKQVDFNFNKGGNGIPFGYTDGMLSEAFRGDEREEKLRYDSSGRVIELEDQYENITKIFYDARGNVIEKRNALGQSIFNTYDHRNRLMTEKDARGGVTSYFYDGNNNLERSSDAMGISTYYTYDLEDRLIEVKDKHGRTTQTRYDALGQVVEQIGELGASTRYTYDEIGNRTEVFGPTGVRVAAIAYNKFGAPVSLTNANGHTTSFEYDVLNRKTAQTDEAENRTEYAYDRQDRLVKVTDPELRTFENVYMNDDVLEKVLDGEGNETTFTYTDINQVHTITTPRNKTMRFEYSDSGHIALFDPPSHKAQGFTYNEAGRLIRTEHLDEDLPDVINQFDANGNLTNVSTQASPGAPLERKISRTYDKLDRQISNTDAQGNTILHDYDYRGLVTRLFYSDTEVVLYAYDDAGRLTTITDWANRVTEYKWNIRNQITEIIFPNQASRSIKYDETGRMVSRADYDAQGTPIVRFDYDYDPRGYISFERRNPALVGYELPPSNFTYHKGQLVAKDGIPIRYDEDGNIVEGPISGEWAAFNWDYRNNLSQAGAAHFNYDIEDRLIGWQVGAETRTFAVIGGAGGSQILVNQSSSGSTTRYIYGVGLAYEEVDGEIFVYHYDEQGNTIALTGADGAVSGTIAYSPYGTIVAETGHTETLFKFGGLFGVVTGPNGLNYMRFRWYSPEMKRFISLDSSLGDIVLPGSLNRYSYAGNNPINFADPDGEFVHILVGAVGGAIVGAVVEVVSAKIQGRPIEWQNVVAAAIGGAVAGGFSAAGCPACGGALGSLTEDLSREGLNYVSKDNYKLNLDLAGLAGGAVLGGISAGISGPVGKKISDKASSAIAKRAIRKSLRKQFFSEPGSLAAIKASESLAQRSAARFIEKTTGQLIKAEAIKGLKTPLKVGSKILSDHYFPDRKSSGGDGSGPSARTGIIINSATALPTVNRGKGGENVHYQLYLNSLNAAGRPFPSPINNLRTF